MSRKNFYLTDRARILKYQPSYNKRVIDTEDAPVATGSWIRARLRPVSGDENRNEQMTKMVFNYELVLHKEDESGNGVVLSETDEFELRTRVNGALSNPLSSLIITGAIAEVRKNNRIVSYVVPVAWETEQ